MSIEELEQFGRPSSGGFDRTPPQDVAAEQSVLGGMLISKDAIADVIEQLRSSAQGYRLAPELRKEKARIMRRILDNDAQIRILAEPWLASLDPLLQGRPQFVH